MVQGTKLRAVISMLEGDALFMQSTHGKTAFSRSFKAAWSNREHTNIPWVVLVCLVGINNFSLGVGVQVGDSLALLFELITQVS